jgi:hypothetical protein
MFEKYSRHTQQSQNLSPLMFADLSQLLQNPPVFFLNFKHLFIEESMIQPIAELRKRKVFGVAGVRFFYGLLKKLSCAMSYIKNYP